MSEKSHCDYCGVPFDKRPYKERKDDPNSVTLWNHDCDAMKPDHVEVDSHYFACRCSGKARAECEWIKAEAYRILGAGTHATTDSNLLTKAVYQLWWAWQATITGMPCDQWCAVTSDYMENGDDKKGAYIQCDTLEDGVCATVVFYAQKFGEEGRPEI